jgi:hypothetical protein
MVQTAEQLIINIRRMQQLGRDAHEETHSYTHQTLQQLERHRFEHVTRLRNHGRSERTIRLFVRDIDQRRRNLQHQLERLSQIFQEEDENMESLQVQVRRVVEHFRERERYNAVRSAFLQPTSSINDSSKDYRASTGRILQSSNDAEGTKQSRNKSCGLLAQFGDSDSTTTLEHGTCVICLVDFQCEDTIVRNAIREGHTRCNHMFHDTCIASWIESSQKAECPCCRQPFVVKS